jgi:hypothetical protein
MKTLMEVLTEKFRETDFDRKIRFILRDPDFAESIGEWIDTTGQNLSTNQLADLMLEFLMDFTSYKRDPAAFNAALKNLAARNFDKYRSTLDVILKQQYDLHVGQFRARGNPSPTADTVANKKSPF